VRSDIKRVGLGSERLLKERPRRRWPSTAETAAMSRQTTELYV